MTYNDKMERLGMENNKSIETVMICYENTDEWIKNIKRSE